MCRVRSTLFEFHFGLRSQDMESLATNHECSRDGKTAHGVGKDRSVNDAEIVDAIDPKLGVYAIIMIVPWPHSASRLHMVTEGIVFEALRQTSRQTRLDKSVWRIGGSCGVENTCCELKRFRKGLQVMSSIVFKKVKVDEGCVPRVRGAQSQRARRIAGLHFDHGPEKCRVGNRKDSLRVAREEATEVNIRRAEEEDITVVVETDARSEPHGQRRTTLAVRPHAVILPQVQAWVLGSGQVGVESAISRRIVLPWDMGLHGNATFVIVLHVVALHYALAAGQIV